MLAIASEYGVGEVPHSDEAEVLLLETTAADLLASLKRDEELVENPPTRVREAIASFDPDARAIVFPHPVLDINTTSMCGRPIVGHRPAAWAALEDKLVADALWDAAGVTRAPSIIVDASRNAVLAASREVDRGVGTVWAADASQRPTGGAEGTRWVRGDVDAEEAFSSFLPFTKRFRVMPFLEGMPFSVMGMVFADAVAALRPVENIVLRSADPPAFRYAGVATWWDPSPDDREDARQSVRRVGAALRERYGFRGAFTVDGVMSVDGFRPTELNPRLGASMIPFQLEAPETCLEVVSRALIAEPDRAVDGYAFEDEAVAALDTHRGGGAWMPADTGHGPTKEHLLVRDATRFRRATEDESPDAVVVTGPGTGGGRIEFWPRPSIVAPGTAVAPLAVEAFAWADAELNTNIGPLSPAHEVRGPAG